MLLTVQILFLTPSHPRVGEPEATRATRAARAGRAVAEDLPVLLPVALASAAKEMLAAVVHRDLQRVQVVAAGQEQLAQQDSAMDLAMAVTV